MADSLTLIQQEYDLLKGNLDNINQSIRKFNWNKNNQNAYNPQGREIERTFNKPNGLVVRIQNNIYNDSQVPKEAINNTIVDHEYDDNISINNDESLSEGEIDEAEEKPKLQSSVTQIIRPVKSREEAMVGQTDNKLIARNKRMFGHLLNTLNQFKKESDNAKEKMRVNQRKEIEKKLDEKAVQERHDMITEKRKLFKEQIDAKNKIKALEIKIEILRLEEAWEDYQRQMKVFIKTKTHPCMYYLPSTMSPDTQTKLEESIKMIEQAILERRAMIEEELKKLDDPNFFIIKRTAPNPTEKMAAAEPNQDGGGGDDDGEFSRSKFANEKSLPVTHQNGPRNQDGGDRRAQRRADINYAVFQFRRVVEQKIKSMEAGKIFDPRRAVDEKERQRNRSEEHDGSSKRNRNDSRSDRRRKRSRHGDARDSRRDRKSTGHERDGGAPSKPKTKPKTSGDQQQQQHKARTSGSGPSAAITKGALDQPAPKPATTGMADLHEDDACVNIPLNVGDERLEQSSYLDTSTEQTIAYGILNFSTSETAVKTDSSLGNPTSIIPDQLGAGESQGTEVFAEPEGQPAADSGDVTTSTGGE